MYLTIVRVLVLLLCVVATPVLAQQAAAKPETPKADTACPRENGSLWSEAADSEFLYYDRKARVEGDLVTVRIVEESQATRSAKTELGRESSNAAGVSALFGLETSVPAVRPNINPSALVGTSTSSAFSGDGLTERSGSLTATVTARVIKVLPNRNLVIFGQQEVKINNETQVLTVRGIVRPEDIAVDNEVLSTHLADAKIEYTGVGPIATRNNTPWLGEVVNKVWPF